MTATNDRPAKEFEGVIEATERLRRWARAAGDPTAIALAAAITHHNWHAAGTMPAAGRYDSPAAKVALEAVASGVLPRQAFNNEAADGTPRTTTGEQAAVTLRMLGESDAPADLLSVLTGAYGVDLSVPGSAPGAAYPSGFSRPGGAISRRGGIAYVPPARAEGETEDGSALYLRNPDLIDRGTTAHKDTQDALARRITEHGLEPISPNFDDQQFDIAWITGDTLHLCEVKSLTVDNEESQLRLGLGQLLSYLHRTNLDHWERVADIRGVLAVERPPGRSDWVDICTANGVTLTWPDGFSALFED
jgi:hypothetical protein